MLTFRIFRTSASLFAWILGLTAVLILLNLATRLPAEVIFVLPPVSFTLYRFGPMLWLKLQESVEAAHRSEFLRQHRDAKLAAALEALEAGKPEICRQIARGLEGFLQGSQGDHEECHSAIDWEEVRPDELTPIPCPAHAWGANWRMFLPNIIAKLRAGDAQTIHTVLEIFRAEPDHSTQADLLLDDPSDPIRQLI